MNHFNCHFAGFSLTRINNLPLNEQWCLAWEAKCTNCSSLIRLGKGIFITLLSSTFVCFLRSRSCPTKKQFKYQYKRINNPVVEVQSFTHLFHEDKLLARHFVEYAAHGDEINIVLWELQNATFRKSMYWWLFLFSVWRAPIN